MAVVIKVTKTFTRPNTNISFHHQILNNEEFKKHMKKNYYETGKVISEENLISEDKLSFTYCGIWKTKADFNEYDVDPVLQKYWESRDSYNNKNNIVSGDKIFSEVEI